MASLEMNAVNNSSPKNNVNNNPNPLTAYTDPNYDPHKPEPLPLIVAANTASRAALTSVSDPKAKNT